MLSCRRLTLLCGSWAALCGGAAEAAYFPMYSSWPQPDGPGTPIELTYSYANLLNGDLRDARTGLAIDADLLRGAFEAALGDYAEILPIIFREIADVGPQPETGEYTPTGTADIRVSQVPRIDGANAYAYFPHSGSGLAGDIVFNAGRFGNDWSLTLFYGVAQHELGHTLGMGHALDFAEETRGTAQSSLYTGPLFPLQDDMKTALQAVYGAGLGAVIPLTPAAVPLPAPLGLFAAGFMIGFPRSREGTRTLPTGDICMNLTVTEIKAFVPAEDFALSIRFYQDMGFTMASIGGGVAYFHHGNAAFLLQDYCHPGLSENLMMHLLVEDVDAWWQNVSSLNLTEKYGTRFEPPALQSWGMRDFVLNDPSGVIWRIGQNVPL